MLSLEKSTQTDQADLLPRKLFGLRLKDSLKFISSLLLPLVLGVFTLVITMQQQQLAKQQREQDRVSADRQREQDRNLSELQRVQEKNLNDERYQNEVLNNYIKEMAKSLNENDGSLTKNEVTATVARVKTLNIFRQLDAKRNIQIIRFLYEAKQLDKSQENDSLDLSTAELCHMDFRESAINKKKLNNLSLTGLFVSNATFIGIDMEHDNFSHTVFDVINFSSTHMRNTIFLDSRLKNTNFSCSQLNIVNLTSAKLENINFCFTKLKNIDFVQVIINNSSFEFAILENINFSNTTLDNLNFSSTKLVNVNLSSTTLNNIDFTNATLNNIDFTNTTLNNIDFTNATLKNVDFSFTKLKRVNFTNSSLFNCNFSVSILLDIDFSVSQLDGVKFLNSTLYNVSFSKASLFNADLSLAHLEAIQFLSTHLDHANFSFSKLSNIEFSFARLEDGKFLNATLSGVRFSQASILNTDMSLAQLGTTQFPSAHLDHVNFSDALLTDVGFSSALLANAILVSSKFHRVNFSSAEIGYADFSSAFLASTDFLCANIYYTDFRQTTFSTVHFIGATLSYSNFSYSDAKHASFVRSSLSYIDFSDANFYKANFTGANITESQFESALSIQDATLPNGTLAHDMNLIENGQADCNINLTLSWTLKNDDVFTVSSDKDNYNCKFTLKPNRTRATISQRVNLSNKWSLTFWPNSHVVLSASMSIGVSIQLRVISSIGPVWTVGKLSSTEDNISLPLKNDMSGLEVQIEFSVLANRNNNIDYWCDDIRLFIIYGIHPEYSKGSNLGTTVAGITSNGGISVTQLKSPTAIFVTPSSFMYIVDNGNQRIQKWRIGEPSGSTVAGGNGPGSALSQISISYGIYIHNEYNIYVSDYGNHRVVLWNAGNTTGGRLVAGGNGNGNADNQLSLPYGIYVDQNGTLYIAEYGNHIISKWLPSKTTMFLMHFSRQYLDAKFGITIAGETAVAAATTITTELSPNQLPNVPCADARWSNTSRVLVNTSEGNHSAISLLFDPYDFIIDVNDNIYVADGSNNRVIRFATGSTSGEIVAGMGSGGKGKSELAFPTALFLTRNYTLFIADSNNSRVQKWKYDEPLGFTVAGGDGSGVTLDKISVSYGLYVDDQYNVYVSEYENHRVTLWMNNNKTIGRLVAGGNGNGTASNQLNCPRGIHVTTNGTIYIADYNNHRIQKWTRDASSGWTVAGQSGVNGSSSRQLWNPTAVLVDQYNNLFILDTRNTRIQKWPPGSIDGSTVISIPASFIGYSMRFDQAGNLLVVDGLHKRIISFPVVCSSNATGRVFSRPTSVLT
ncbi:unnamed protein product [Rotaria socialis]